MMKGWLSQPKFVPRGKRRVDRLKWMLKRYRQEVLTARDRLTLTVEVSTIYA